MAGDASRDAKNDAREARKRVVNPNNWSRIAAGQAAVARRAEITAEHAAEAARLKRIVAAQVAVARRAEITAEHASHTG